jgi:hypothetical protein
MAAGIMVTFDEGKGLKRFIADRLEVIHTPGSSPAVLNLVGGVHTGAYALEMRNVVSIEVSGLLGGSKAGMITGVSMSKLPTTATAGPRQSPTTLVEYITATEDAVKRLLGPVSWAGRQKIYMYLNSLGHSMNSAVYQFEEAIRKEYKAFKEKKADAA